MMEEHNAHEKINYRNMFILRIRLFSLRIVTGLIPLLVLGFALAVISLANRGKWQQR